MRVFVGGLGEWGVRGHGGMGSKAELLTLEVAESGKRIIHIEEA